MNPWLSPQAISELATGIRSRAAELVDAVVAEGGCEFMHAFGTPFPVSIFMQLMGLPAEHTARFLAWEHQLLQGDMVEKVHSAKAILDYLRALIEARRLAPTGDLASLAVHAKIDNHPLTDDEIVGICYLLFVGGLDTVASSLGFYFRHLATHPGHQERLRKNPSDIPSAVEEYLRSFSVVQSHRRATQDLELAGLQIKKGDWFTVHHSLASLDPHEFPNPLSVDYDRENIRHFGFAFGPHFCLGQHLARRELNIAIEEWMTRVPPFRVVAGERVKTHGGGVFGVDRLMLTWR